jgi:hypothetical protein
MANTSVWIPAEDTVWTESPEEVVRVMAAAPVVMVAKKTESAAIFPVISS